MYYLVLSLGMNGMDVIGAEILFFFVTVDGTVCPEVTVLFFFHAREVLCALTALQGGHATQFENHLLTLAVKLFKHCF